MTKRKSNVARKGRKETIYVPHVWENQKKRENYLPKTNLKRR